MLSPKRTKYRKTHKGRITGKAWTGSSVSYGDFGLAGLEHGLITARQIEAARVAINRHLKREKQARVFIRIFPDKPITRKALGVRMGSGKGSVEFWAAVIRPGAVLYEVEGVSEQLAREAFARAAQKLPLAAKFVSRAELETP